MLNLLKARYRSRKWTKSRAQIKLYLYLQFRGQSKGTDQLKKNQGTDQLIFLICTLDLINYLDMAGSAVKGAESYVAFIYLLTKVVSTGSGAALTHCC